MKVHHVGYIVKNMEKAIPAFEILGYTVKKSVFWDEGRKSSFCFMENDGYVVELVQPSDESDLFPLLKQYPNMPYHICYKCDNIDKTGEILKEQKYMMFKQPEPAPAIGDCSKVAFFMSARGGMIELLEE